MDASDIETRVGAMGADGRVSAADVLALRREIYPDGAVAREELAAVFSLAERAPDGDAEWSAFFAELCADYFLNEETPRGYLTEEEFEFLRRAIVRDGGRVTDLELETLVALAERARSTPDAMTVFTADEFRRRFNEMEAPSVSAADASLLKRFVYAAGGEGVVAVGRGEAELLLDIENLCRAGPNAPEWGALFATALSAHLMQHVDAEPVSRDEAKRLQKFVEDRASNPVGFFQRMLKGGLKGFGRDPAAAEAEATAVRRAAAIAEAEEVTAAEANWVAARIGRDGALSAPEIALIERLKDLGAELPEPLARLAKAS